MTITPVTVKAPGPPTLKERSVVLVGLCPMFLNQNNHHKAGARNPDTWEAEAWGLTPAGGQPGLHREILCGLYHGCPWRTLVRGQSISDRPPPLHLELLRHCFLFVPINEFCLKKTVVKSKKINISTLLNCSPVYGTWSHFHLDNNSCPWALIIAIE